MRTQVSIGISGVQARVGCTHTCIMMANFLRGKGYKVALVELNDSCAFEDIRTSSNSKLSLTKFFRYNDIDYYPYFNKMILKTITNKEYQFVIIDFGNYVKSHKPAFCNCDASIFISGTKPWEINNLNNVFDDIDQDSLKNYYFYFTFSANNEEQKKEILTGMDYVENNIFFPPYVENPFTQGCFPGLKIIISNILEKHKSLSHRKAVFGRSEDILDIEDALSRLMDGKPSNESNRASQSHLNPRNEGCPKGKQIPKFTEIEENIEEKIQEEISNYPVTEDIPKMDNEIQKIAEDQLPEHDTPLIDDSLFNNSGFSEIKDSADNKEEPIRRVRQNHDIENHAKANFRDILVEDHSPIQKMVDSAVKEFNIRNFSKDKNLDKKHLKKYEYTQKQTENIIFESRDGMRKIKFTDVENKELLTKLSSDIFNDTFCMAIRSGMECKEKTAKKTGAPILAVNIDSRDIFCGKDAIENILGDEFSLVTLIKESED